jgi:hypothetical protein
LYSAMMRAPRRTSRRISRSSEVRIRSHSTEKPPGDRCPRATGVSTSSVYESRYDSPRGWDPKDTMARPDCHDDVNTHITCQLRRWKRQPLTIPQSCPRRLPYNPCG